MTKILAPGFDFFRTAAMRISKVGQHMAKAMRRERGKADIHECGFEDLADPRCAGPELPAYAIGDETGIGIQFNQGLGEEGVLIAE